MTDLISRADAIEAVAQQWLFEASAESPYVNDDDIDDYRKLAEELLSDIPSAEAEQVTSKLHNPCDSLLKDDSDTCKESESKLDLISRELAMERIANDNVFGGMERINEYNNSTEFNNYLGGISDAITTIFCDVPSADITETETCQKCQDVTDKILNRQGEEIERLKSIINVLNRPSAEAVQGEWIEREDWNGDNYYDCSVCGESFVLFDGTPSMNLYHYCPNCGARMTPYKGGEDK